VCVEVASLVRKSFLYALLVYIYMYIYMYVCIYVIHKNILIYISGPSHTAALGSRIRPRQDRGGARGGKSGPLCARSGECLERD
jgi:hypothetical protein